MTTQNRITLVKNNYCSGTVNTDSGIYNGGASAIDASRCWWGSTDSATVYGYIHGPGSASVTVAPFRLGLVDTSSGADTIAPVAPATLAVSDSSYGACTLSWAAAATNEEVGGALGDLAGYRIYRDTDANPSNWSSLLIEQAPAATSYCDSGLQEGATYYYRITAYDNHSPWANESWYSDSIAVFTVSINTSPTASTTNSDTQMSQSETLWVDGSGSSDTDGPNPLLYLWTASDTNVVFANTYDSITSVTFDTPGYFQVTLSVSDGPDTVTSSFWVDAYSAAAGDFTSTNGSAGIVDIEDFKILQAQAASYWGVAPVDSRTDLVADGVLDFEDIAEFAKLYGQ